MKPNIFISHSNFDKPIARKIRELIGAERVWLDEPNLELGKYLAKQLSQAVKGSRYWILLWSRNAKTSRWVEYEREMAIIDFLEGKMDGLLVIPLDETEIPAPLRPFAKYRGSKTAEAIALAINNFCGASIPLSSSCAFQKIKDDIDPIYKDDKIIAFMCEIIGRGTKFAQNHTRDLNQKRDLAKPVARILQRCSQPNDIVYFGPGSTIYEIFSTLANLNIIKDLRIKVITSNLPILLSALEHNINCKIVGSSVVREYTSFVFSKGELSSIELKYPIMHAIIGIAGLDQYLSDHIEFRSCWEEHKDILNHVIKSAKNTVIIPFHAAKLLTADGNTFLTSEEICDNLQSNPAKSFTMIVGTETLQGTEATFNQSIVDLQRFFTRDAFSTGEHVFLNRKLQGN